MSFRTYRYKIAGEHDWKISELIKLSRFNEGKCSVECDSKNYAITVKEIKE